MTLHGTRAHAPTFVVHSNSVRLSSSNELNKLKKKENDSRAKYIVTEKKKFPFENLLDKMDLHTKLSGHVEMRSVSERCQKASRIRKK